MLKNKIIAIAFLAIASSTYCSHENRAREIDALVTLSAGFAALAQQAGQNIFGFTLTPHAAARVLVSTTATAVTQNSHDSSSSTQAPMLQPQETRTPELYVNMATGNAFIRHYSANNPEGLDELLGTIDNMSVDKLRELEDKINNGQLIDKKYGHIAIAHESN